MKKTIALALGLLASHFAFGQAATIAVGTPLSIFEGQQKVTVQTAKGPVTVEYQPNLTPGCHSNLTPPWSQCLGY